MAFDPVSAMFDVGGKLIDKLIPDPQAKAEAAFKLLQLQQTGELAELAATTDLAKGQLEVNKAEAANPNGFTSGWRPAVGWVCATGLAVQFLVRPFVLWASDAGWHVKADFPSLDMGTLITLLAGMLGLGAMRTVEKVQGVAK